MKDLKYKTKHLINKKRKRLSLPFLGNLSLFSFFPFLLFSFSPPTAAQSGGAFTIEKSVISSGGGTVAGGSFIVESVIGQPSADRSQSQPFDLFGGFITPTSVATAANVSISGRVTTANGAGIRSVNIILNYPNGTSRTVSTGSFGAFQFDGVPVGEIYVITVSGKKFSFKNPVQVISLNEQISDLNFVAIEQ